MARIESRSGNDLLSRAREVACSSLLKSDYFQKMGIVASEAILREDKNALTMISGGIELQFSNPLLLANRHARLRLHGTRSIVAGGLDAILRLQDGNDYWPDRDTNRTSLHQAINDLLLARQQERSILAMARVIPDAIQSMDREYMQFGATQLERLRSEEAPEEVRMLATGMLDVLTPALQRVSTHRSLAA